MDRKIKSIEEINKEFAEQNKLVGAEEKDKPEKAKEKNKLSKSKKKDKELSGKDETSSKRKAGSFISDVIFCVAFVAMVVLAFVFSRGDGGNIKVGSYRLFEVLTSSMESVYPRGSIIFVKETSANELVIGDDITFLRSEDTVVTQRIIKIEEDYAGTGRRGFVTKGVDNINVDDDTVLEADVIGKVTKSFPKIGAMLSWVSERLTAVVFLGGLIVVAFFLKNFWRDNKKEE